MVEPKSRPAHVSLVDGAILTRVRQSKHERQGGDSAYDLADKVPVRGLWQSNTKLTSSVRVLVGLQSHSRIWISIRETLSKGMGCKKPGRQEREARHLHRE